MAGRGRTIAASAPSGFALIAPAVLAMLALGSCTIIPQGIPPNTPPAPSSTDIPVPPPPPPTALQLGVKPGAPVAGLPLGTARAAGALRSFVESCPRLVGRADTSGLTQPADWQDACTAARTTPAADASAFFTRWFETAQVGEGTSLVTGYYEPEIAGTRTRQPGFEVPVYRMPPDLVRGWPDDWTPEQRTGTQPLGRIDESGKFVLYHDRAAIEDGALANKGLEIGWAADPIELFFLEIQGSGRLLAPDGSVMRIGYAGQNGREYLGIGAEMRRMGLIGEGPGQYPGSMQGLMRYLREHPAEGRDLMRRNLSYIFFREITGDGPIGALGVPVRAQASVAIDPKYTPLGAPVWLANDRPEATGLWIAQDTGGAIKGANRYDTFWGAGPTARTIAGGMSARGTALVLLPKGTLARLGIQ